MKKKCIALVLAVLMLAAIGVISASAAGSASLVVAADKTTAAPGDSVALTLTLKPGTSKVNGLEATMKLPAGLTCVGDPKLGGNFLLEDYNASTGKLNLVISGKGTLDSIPSGAGSGMTADAVVLTVPCKVDDSVADGTSLKVEVSVADCFDASNATVTCTTTAATIAVKASAPAGMKGDVNGDGKISVADYTLVLAHVKGTKLITDAAKLKAADVNGDGKVSVADYTLILAHVKGTKLLA